MNESTDTTMSLRLRLILLFGGLLVVLLGAAFWWSQWLTQQMSTELDEAAVFLGQQVVSAVGEEDGLFDVRTNVVREAPKVSIVVERTITSEDREVRAVHREEDGHIVGFSVQVNDDPAQLVEFPSPEMHWEPAPAEIHVSAIREEIQGGRLRLMGQATAREIPIPDQGVQQVVNRFSRQLIIGLTALFTAALALAAWIAHRVSDPLRNLQLAADRIGHGELGVQVDGDGVSEVNAAVRAFNSMSVQLEHLEETRQALRDNQHLSEIGEIGRGLAHSLRNPLNAIGLTIEEMLARGGNDPASQELAEDARRQIQRIDESIRAFLILANAGSTDSESILLQDLVRDVALEVVQRGGSGVDVDTKLPDEPLTLHGLATEVRAMIQALVVNAAEASEAGDTVELALEQDEDAVRIVVRDRGRGLSEEIRERLFEPHATTKADGSGMGLYLTRRLAVNRYGGDLTIETRDGGGVRAVLTMGNRTPEHTQETP